MKRQASYHGEIGANGRAYQKGQFIAEQPDYQNTKSKKHKSTGKQQIEPYVWEVPEEGQKSIFQFVQGIFGNVFTGEINLNAIEVYGSSLEQVQSLIARYQNGERWFYPDHEIYL